MSKPMLVTVPFVLLLPDYWPLERLRSAERVVPNGRQRPGERSATGIRGLLVEKAPFFLLSAVSCVITFRVQQSGGAVLDVSNFPISARIANALTTAHETV